MESTCVVSTSVPTLTSVSFYQGELDTVQNQRSYYYISEQQNLPICSLNNRILTAFS